MSGAWSIYVIVLSLLVVGGSAWLLAMTAKKPEKKEGETTGHVWDDDLAEYNNPLPRWWLWLFIGTIIFSAGYLVLYPGFGANKGTLGWSSEGQLLAEQQKYEEIARQTYAKFAALSVADLAKNAEAVNLGRNIFANNCAACHGTDGRGAVGFPNLTDASWQWGGEADQIYTTILNGRMAAMPSWSAVLGAEGTPQVAAYVRSLAGLGHDATAAAAGKPRYEQICVACHGIDGKGNPALGAPNLTDADWLYGSSEATIVESLTKGRNGQMPAHGPLIGADAVKIVSGYVYSLRDQAQSTASGGEK
ncbi:MAG: cytochrome-c oxidase, cbb3-type subunit III [Rhodanobacteraceae bacterium]|nr:cytochrome-c oxidase, cbb3-type subunit III [Rhodanobacteraceae bacterium]